MPGRDGWTSVLLFILGGCMRAPAPTPSEAAAPAPEAPSPKLLPLAATAAPPVASQLARVEQTPPPTAFLPAPADPAESDAGRVAEGYLGPKDCARGTSEVPTTLREFGGAKREFSVDGYAARAVAIERTEGGEAKLHCLTVAWPSADTNNEGRPVRVARTIDDAWLRAIENTLLRLPWSHVVLVERIIIDNRPTEHGIAAFDRDDATDARDGRTLWLHEHLFLAPNHWARGNYGSYWGYHVDRDGSVIDDAGPDHDLFSPILLHEIGHLVMYWIANAHLAGPEAASNVECAATCKDRGDCRELDEAAREAGCVSPYCAPFRFESSTENWAEQYRLFFQSSASQRALERARGGCLSWLTRDAKSLPAPWERGLPDISSYRRSLWDSCGGRACKSW
ncbi:MAG TPA: hypothetical protein VFU02_02025 [Polyangiaceae bacterium]|nr:hypothetical protein [Polyangiaceae bacterium]